jgi:hypothetical protein
MKVICNANIGSALGKKHFAIGYTPKSVLHLTVGKEYRIFAMQIWRSLLDVLLSDDTGKPQWYPIEIFKVSDSRLPNDWLFKSTPDEEYGLQALWGYKSIVEDPLHHDGMLELEPEHLKIFEEERRKREELEDNFKNLTYTINKKEI